MVTLLISARLRSELTKLLGRKPHRMPRRHTSCDIARQLAFQRSSQTMLKRTVILS